MLFNEFIRIGEYQKEPNKDALSHFELMKTYFNRAKKVTIFADNDVDFELALIKTYVDLIKGNKLDVMLVRTHDNDDVEKSFEQYN